MNSLPFLSKEDIKNLKEIEKMCMQARSMLADPSVSNEGLIKFVDKIISMVIDTLSKVKNVFYSFTNRNFEEVNVYLRDLKKVKDKYIKLKRKNPDYFSELEQVELAYPEGCKLAFLPLTEILTMLNKTLYANMNFSYDYTNKVLDQIIGSKDFRTSEKPYIDNDLKRFAKIVDDTKKELEKITDADNYTDYTTFSKGFGSDSQYEAGLNNLMALDGKYALSNLKSFLKENKYLSEKTDTIFKMVNRDGNSLAKNKHALLLDVLEQMASFCTYYGATVGWVMEAAKTANVYVETMDKYL